MADKIHLEQIDAHGVGHAYSDKKEPTRYAVYVGKTKIGEVASHSEESWASSGRIRYRMRGYSRCWFGTLTGEVHLSWRRADSSGSTRQIAVDALVEKWRESKRHG